MKYYLKIRTSGNRTSGDRTSGGPPTTLSEIFNQINQTWPQLKA